MMKEQPEWSQEERQFAALLQAEPAQWTPICYEPLDFVELAREGRAYPKAEAMFTHMAGCAYCLQMYADTARACQAADEARAIGPASLPVEPRQSAASPLVASSPPLANPAAPAESWLTRFRRRLFMPVAVGVAFAAGLALFFVLPRHSDQERAMEQAKIATMLDATRSLQAQAMQLKQQNEQANKQLADERKSRSALQKTVLVQRRQFEKDLARAQKAEQGRDADVEKLIASATKDPQELKGLQDGKTQLMSGTQPVLVSPCAERVGGWPEFVWEPLPGVTRYRLTVERQRDGTKIVDKDNLTATHYDLYDLPGAHMLPPGRYIWTIYASGKSHTTSIGEDGADTVPHQSADFVVKALADPQGRKTLLALLLPLARYHYHAGLQQYAKHDYRQVLEADPTNAEARNALRTIDSRAH